MSIKYEPKLEKMKELNMPKVEREIFMALFNVSEFTWSGIANLFCERFGKNDIEELISLLEIENAKR